MTHSSLWPYVGLSLAPLAVAAIGHALRLGGSLLAAVVCVIGVACTAIGTAIGRRTP